MLQLLRMCSNMRTKCNADISSSKRITGGKEKPVAGINASADQT